MEEAKEEVVFEVGIEKQTQELQLEEQEQEHAGDDSVLQFLDSVDSYLTLFDSLSFTLRQGWLELASARHSMGASRLNSSLLDLKCHPAATSLQVTQHHQADSIDGQPHFILRKWGSLGDCNDQHIKEDELLDNSGTSQSRCRRNTQPSEETSPKQPLIKVDDRVQKERSRLLSMFGTLVSPKLRASQISFEKVLETLVEIANMRSAMLSGFDQVCKELNAPRR